MATQHLPAPAPDPTLSQYAPPPPAGGYPAAPAGAYLVPPPPQVRGQSYAAALSFVGSARRLGAIANKAGRTHVALGVLAWAVVSCVIGAVWLFVALWYLVIFGLFGLFTFPYRLMRRSSRKQVHLAQQSLAMQQHMAQTQYALAQQAAHHQHQQQQAWQLAQAQQQVAVPPARPALPRSARPALASPTPAARPRAAARPSTLAPTVRAARMTRPAVPTSPVPALVPAPRAGLDYDPATCGTGRPSRASLSLRVAVWPQQWLSST